ncbi:hypothetical protein HMPREF9370_1021 [Neisseria wadsworthii 9715]|uniref:Uncharacterized protein n=1 Tax=Neisseria wadsworthii 9715 TaxID=1030841 RepID=G4CPL1_9NEIS|nr:hypothetical protein HMPREF9370_1021 [Neisseria wadsworthii 9715]
MHRADISLLRNINLRQIKTLRTNTMIRMASHKITHNPIKKRAFYNKHAQHTTKFSTIALNQQSPNQQFLYFYLLKNKMMTNITKKTLSHPLSKNKEPV